MPLYEYECQACGERTEEIQRFSDDPLTTCEACGGELRKLLSAPAFKLKGTGWYKTDYASSSSSGPKKSGDEGKSGDGEKSTDSSSSSSSSSDSSASSSSGTKKKAESST